MENVFGWGETRRNWENYPQVNMLNNKPDFKTNSGII